MLPKLKYVVVSKIKIRHEMMAFIYSDVDDNKGLRTKHNVEYKTICKNYTIVLYYQCATICRHARDIFERDLYQ